MALLNQKEIQERNNYRIDLTLGNRPPFSDLRCIFMHSQFLYEYSRRVTRQLFRWLI